MVKKKYPGQEENMQETQNELSDIKHDTDTNEIGDTGLQTEESQDEEEKDKGENSVNEITEADKVVTAEKTFEEKLAEMQDKYLRLSAEFDNYRKRTLREKIDLTKYASENILKSLLPFMDDFERAIPHMPDAPEFLLHKQGIELISVKLGEFLKQNGIKEIESLNCPFNVDLHDAVAKLPAGEENMKGKILEVIQKGYYLQDKVIRHAKVVVGE